MPIVRINATAKGPSLHNARGSITSALSRALTTPGPVIIMTHGFKYRPSETGSCPHDSIFASASPQGAIAWPRHLGFGMGCENEGVAIAFGWDARGSLPAVYRRAAEAGRQLADLLFSIKRLDASRKIHIISHSMGSEVAFHALLHAAPGTVARVLCLTGASFRSTAEHAMQSPAGRPAELVNVTTRENDLFDVMFEWMIRPPLRGDRAMGQGLAGRNMVTLQLDHPDHLEALHQLGSPIAPSNRRICHWSVYLRPGVLRLYARAMRSPDQLPIERLAPTPPAPRWSRFVARPSIALPSGTNPAT